MSFISATCSGSTNVPDETGVSRLLVYLSLDVEARLLDRVEADDEILQARLADNEEDLLVQRIHPQPRAAARPLADNC